MFSKLLAIFLALFVYRSGRVAYNHILTRPDLPPTYYVGGDFASHCTPIRDPVSPDVAYCEDITFWDHLAPDGTLTNRLVLLGCDPNRKAWNTVMGPLRDPDPRGHLFLYDPHTRAVQRLALSGYPTTHDFHPLGMDVWPSHDGAPSSLFIINHARAQTTVEQFMLDLSGGPETRAVEARYVRTLRSPYFVSPNAIEMTSPSSFYVTNDHLFTRRLPIVGSVLPVVESVGGLPLSWVAHVSVHERDDNKDGEEDYVLEHTFAALGIAFANGVALSPSHAHLAVASTSLGLVHIYTVNATGSVLDPTALTNAAAAPALTFSHSLPVPFFPDNIDYDDTGALIVTGHPHFPSLIGVAANKTGTISPSWAIAFDPSATDPALRADDDDDDATPANVDPNAPVSASKFVPPATYGIETLFQSDGTVFGSSTTTLRDARTGDVYIAGLYEHEVLMCHPSSSA